MDGMLKTSVLVKGIGKRDDLRLSTNKEIMSFALAKSPN
jgi:hypothetical protein